MVIGVAFAVFGLLLLFVPVPVTGEHLVFFVVLILLPMAGGGILFYYGYRARKLKQITAHHAFQMLRDDDKIDARELSTRVGTTEMKVRQLLVDLQREGLIPFKAVIT